MTYRRHALTLAAALAVASVAPTIFAQTRIAVVDLQRAIAETDDGRRAKARLERLFKQKQKQLDARQTELKRMQEQIEKLADVWTPEKRQQEIAAFQEAYQQLQAEYVQYQRELAEQEARATKAILERMQTLLQRMGQTEGYSLIVEANEGGVVWTPSNLDLTDALIQAYEADGHRANASRSGMSGRRRSED